MVGDLVHENNERRHHFRILPHYERRERLIVYTYTRPCEPNLQKIHYFWIVFGEHESVGARSLGEPQTQI